MTRNDERERPSDDGIDWRLWLRVLRYAGRYRSEVISLVITACLTASVDALFPLLTKEVVDHVVAHGAGARLMPFALQYLGLVFALSVCIGLFIRYAGFLSTHIGHDIRQAGFDRLQDLSLTYFDQRPVGWLVSRMTSDCDRLSRIIAWGLLDFIWGGTLMMAIAVLMLILDWRLALVVLAVVPALIVVSVRFQAIILRSARRVRRANSILTAAYSEGIMGVRTAKVLVREEEALAEFQDLSTEMWRVSVRNALHSAMYVPVVLSLGSIGTGLALWYGGSSALAGTISLGTLLAFLHYSTVFFDPITEVARTMAALQTAQAAAERTLGLIATEPEIRDSAAVVAAITAEEAIGPRAGIAVDGQPDRVERIVFDAVSFAYEGSRHKVLDAFDLDVRAGQTIALVGPTGGGKSTIVGLLARFYEPTEGGLMIDGVDYRERSLAWWRDQVGVVLQTPHLFNGSIRDNIRYGRLDATDDEVEEAAQLVHAHRFIRELERGYSTEVGEGGSRLSIGQRQLLSFARAVIARPRVLVMDEATSSVDTETEGLIQAGLGHLLEERTCFVIAHRLSTIRDADRILMIDRGRIVEDGAHADLMAGGGRYRDLYTGQAVRAATVWS